MNKIWTITSKEFSAFFDSLAAYILLVVFLGMSGFFTWLYSANVFFVGQASLQIFFSVAFWTILFFIPALTMRAIAEERRLGTIELLCTKPISDWDIVVGKYLASLLMVGVALVATLPYYFTMINLGNVDHGGVWGGYLGLFLLSSAYIGIGIFASSLSSNQIVAFLLGLTICVVFHLIFGTLAQGANFFSRLFYFLSTNTHFRALSRGVVDLRDVLYLLSLTALGLFAAQSVLTRRAWL